MKFAKRVYFWSGVYGILTLFPLYFLEEKLGRDYPPATNHPEQYYAFIGVTLVWQFAFLFIARDPARYRPLMIATFAEKLLPVGSVLALYLAGRITGMVLAPFLPDILLCALFIAAYLKTPAIPDRGVAGSPTP
jgi:hypothetical protein